GSGIAVSCGVGCRRGSDPALLWLWCRPVATAPIRPLAWEPPYAAGEAQEIAKRPKKKRKSRNLELGALDVCGDTRLNKAPWAKEIRNDPYNIHVHLSSKHNEDDDSPNKLYTFVTYLPVTTLKNLQEFPMWLHGNEPH
uniref:Uncharacterized protein n=1 Tax=Sus scrofa TaxID=9823 RepID=A0A8D1RY84_PIG